MIGALTVRRPIGQAPLRWAIALAVTALVFSLDQLSKSIAIDQLLSSPREGVGPLRFRLVANRGALLGMPAPTWLIIGVVAAISVAAARAVATGSGRLTCLGWAVLIGGASGNLVDRLQHRPRFPDHAVVDWIASSTLPTFNFADVAIAVGFLLLMLAGDAATTGGGRGAPVGAQSRPR